MRLFPGHGWTSVDTVCYARRDFACGHIYYLPNSNPRFLDSVLLLGGRCDREHNLMSAPGRCVCRVCNIAHQRQVGNDVMKLANGVAWTIHGDMMIE